MWSRDHPMDISMLKFTTSVQGVASPVFLGKALNSDRVLNAHMPTTGEFNSQVACSCKHLVCWEAPNPLPFFTWLSSCYSNPIFCTAPQKLNASCSWDSPVLDWYSIWSGEGIEILWVTSCYRNREMLWHPWDTLAWYMIASTWYTVLFTSLTFFFEFDYKLAFFML